MNDKTRKPEQNTATSALAAVKKSYKGKERLYLEDCDTVRLKSVTILVKDGLIT